MSGESPNHPMGGLEDEDNRENDNRNRNTREEVQPL